MIPSQNFAGRKNELEELRRLLIRGKSGTGGTVLVEGAEGMGKATLVKALEEQCRQSPELETAKFVYATCDQYTGTKDGYQPCVEILAAFAKPDTKGKLKKVWSIIKETAPDWLGLIPIIGGAAKASAATVAVTSKYILTHDDERQPGKTGNYLKTIVKIASEYTLLVLVFMDAQWMDDASCQLLVRLAGLALKNRLVLLITYRPEETKEHVAFETMKSEMVKDHLARLMILGGWSEEEIKEYLQIRFGGILNRALPAWLRELSNGEPYLVTDFVSDLETRGVIRRSEGKFVLDGDLAYMSGEWKLGGALVPVPSGTTQSLQHRLSNLTEDERQILQVGAVQGNRFMSRVLAKSVEKGELDLLRVLRGVKEHHRIISIYPGEEWSRLKSQVYAFESSLVHQTFYDRLEPYEKTLYHQSIAGILETILKDEVNPRRNLVIETARHHALGDNPLAAARYYYQAAQTSFFDGALKETAELCRQAVENLRTLPEGVPDHDRLRAESIRLWLLSAEQWWRGKPELQGQLQLLPFADEAIAAATRAGDQALLAHATYLKGKIFVTTNNLDRAVETMKQALALAREAGDRVAEFVIMSELGHQMVGARAIEGADFLTGLTLQLDAHKLFETHLKSQTGPHVADLNRLFFRLKGTIGVGEFDRGRFEEATSWLKKSIEGLKSLKKDHELSWASNFLGQAYTAMGLFGDAERILKDAIGLYADEDGPIVVQGYNRAQLGKLYMEWDRIEEAEGPLLQGWKETEATWNMAIVPLVRNYYAELLMCPGFKSQNLSKADEQIHAAIDETEQSGFGRSRIVALSLWSKLDLLREDPESAVAHSAQAVDALHKMGTMPALREEEVLFQHYAVLKAAGREGARRYLDEAYEALQKKAVLIKDETIRHSFLEKVPVSRAIVSAFEDS